MKHVDRQKMCTGCDARIAVDAKECIYCGAEQAVQAAAHSPLFKQQTLQDSLASLYTPPYSAKAGSSAFSTEDASKMKPSLSTATLNMNQVEENEEEAKSALWPIFFLISAGNLLTLGLLQLFFSDNGILRLEWNSHYWFLYCFLSLPLFFFGFKKAKSL